MRTDKLGGVARVVMLLAMVFGLCAAQSFAQTGSPTAKENSTPAPTDALPATNQAGQQSGQSGAGVKVAAAIAPVPGAPTQAEHDGVAFKNHAAEGETDGARLFDQSDASERANSTNWSVDVTKSRHELDVYYKNRLFKTYHAVFGRSRWGGPKEWEGDMRTPEGPYLIIGKHYSPRFRWFLRLSYPNRLDQEKFDELRAAHEIPASAREGGSIGIHGTDEPLLNLGDVNWTTGCISVDNSDISELERLLPIGTLVVIKP